MKMKGLIQNSYTEFIFSFSLFISFIQLMHKKSFLLTCVLSSLILSLNFGLGSCQLYNNLDPVGNAETCTSPWIDFDFPGFKQTLTNKVYGQPHISVVLPKAIDNHWNDKQSAKALVLLFYGPTGTGKSYVAQLLVNLLYKEGTSSQFYHLFPATMHFHKGQLQADMDRLQNWIRGNVTHCRKSVFVFDEADKMEHEVFDALRPYLDYHESIDGIDYHSAIFILLFTEESNHIEKLVLKWKQEHLDGARTDLFNSFEFKDTLYKYFYTESPLRNSVLLQQHLVSHFIPFLPLDRDHVARCITDYLQAERPDLANSMGRKSFIDRVINELIFRPGTGQLFIESGCKRIRDKVRSIVP